MDNVITLAMLALLAFGLLCGAKFHPQGNTEFFNIENTKAMRAFWSIIVVLVHIPTIYQNRVQDMAGSFAYIGVTFFFMTSAFGLTLSAQKNGIKTLPFWKKRLPKLLIPQFFTNAIYILLCATVLKEQVLFSTVFYINHWIIWLLCCYVLFWLAKMLFKNKTIGDVAICIGVIAGSVLMYVLKQNSIITQTIWPTEVYGFIWGLLLAKGFEGFRIAAGKKWIISSVVCCGVALLLGVLYLKFKPVVFFGDYILKIVLGLAITLFVLLLNSKISLGNKIISFIGEISYETFLVHWLVTEFVTKVFGGVSSGVFILLTIVLTLMVAFVVHKLSELVIKCLSRVGKA